MLSARVVFSLSMLAVAALAMPSLWYCQAPLPAAIAPPADMTLEQVHVVVRHGDRTPSFVMANMFQQTAQSTWTCDLSDLAALFPPLSVSGDKYSPTLAQRITTVESSSVFAPQYWLGNCTLGQLTLRGAQQQLAMGSKLRDIYVEQFGLLPRTLRPSLIYARADEEWRTQQSAAANLEGMYPSSDRPVADAFVPVHVFPAEIETMEANDNQCPVLKQLAAAAFTTPAWQQYNASTWPVVSKLFEVVGAQDYWGFPGYFWDPLAAMYCHDMPLPCLKSGACVTASDFDVLASNVSWGLSHTMIAMEQLRFAIGPFFQDIVTRANMYHTGAAGATPYNLYSAHDDTLVMMLNGLQVDWNQLWPAYASSLQMEIFTRNNETAYVRLIYNGEVLAVPSWCDGAYEGMCPWTSFQAYLGKFFSFSLSECYP